MPFGDIMGFILFIPAILIGITFHEFAHGLVAYRLGDPTPKYQGRLTLNPVAHLDPIGTLLLLFAHFGWAKPVQVNPAYFEGDRRRGMMIVSLAGPFANVVLAYLGALLLGLMLKETIPFNHLVAEFLQDLIQINLVLAAFNLIPVPPLDGSKILAGILPRESANLMDQIEQYGPIILMVLIVTGTAQKLFLPIVKVLAKIIFMSTGIPY